VCVILLDKYIKVNHAHICLATYVQLLYHLNEYHLRQFRQSGDLESPALVVRQVQVEFV